MKTYASSDNRNCLSDKDGGQQRYTVWRLYNIKHYNIRENEYPGFRIKKTMNNAVIGHDVRKIINNIKNRGFNEDCDEDVYVCPICGNSLAIKQAPMGLGDDHVCQCPNCHNIFVFGGTYPHDFKFTPLEDLSPNPHKLAYQAMLTKSEMLAKKEGKSICRFDDVVLIMENLKNKYQVTHMMELCE